MRPVCAVEECKEQATPAYKYSKLGFPLYKKYCRRHKHEIWDSRFTYRRSKGSKCVKCGFTPKHRAQLDVDHIDENHGNNDPANLQTLCKNCHSLKTHAPELFKIDPNAG